MLKKEIKKKLNFKFIELLLHTSTIRNNGYSSDKAQFFLSNVTTKNPTKKYEIEIL